MPANPRLQRTALHGFLSCRAAAIVPELGRLAHDSVPADHEGHRVLADRAARGAHGFGQANRDVLAGQNAADRDAQQRLPDLDLEVGPSTGTPETISPADKVVEPP
jgi:hypothetical protein